MLKRKHYYNFAFLHSKGNVIKTAAVCVGYPQKFVSIPQINSAKESAKVPTDAVMLSCCYLGKLTKEEMETSKTRRSTDFFHKLLGR